MFTRLILPLIFGLVGVAILVSLGTWQVRRLAEKEAYLANIQTQITAEPVALPAEPDPVDDRFLSVAVNGRYMLDHIDILASAKNFGAGFRVIQRFLTDDGRLILIDRGFVPVAARDNPRAIGPAQLIGNLHWPDEVDSFTPEPDLDAAIWYARDVPAMAEALRTEPILLVLKSSIPADPQITPFPVGIEGIPNDHLEYAVTWYGLAVVWLAMTVYFVSRSRKAA